MDDRFALELVASAIVYPAVVLALHYWYVRKRRHPDWVPWRATGRFIWELLWPVVVGLAVLGLAVVVIIVQFAPLEKWPPSGKALGSALAPIIVLGVLIPAFYRARRLITEPPKK